MARIGTAAAALVLVATHAAWLAGATPAERVAEHKAVAARIEAVEKKIEAQRAPDSTSDAARATRYLETARLLLEMNNERGARRFVESAERLLRSSEGAQEQP